MKLTIEWCKKEDKDNLVSFLRDYWKEDHILVKSPEFMEWQHGNKDGGLNFMIAKDSDNNILGVYGVIPTFRYDEELSSKHNLKEAWGAIWKVRPDCKIPGLGVLLSRSICKEYDFLGGLGLSPDAQNYYKTIKADFGVCNQFYVINPLIHSFKIASVTRHSITNTTNIVDTCKLRDIDDLENENEICHTYYPIKSLAFIVNRYLNHPVYEYKFLACDCKESTVCILVYREISVNGAKCARIVDVYGDISKVNGLGYALTNYMKEHNDIEYFDMYNHGLDKERMIESGFSVVNNTDGIVIPNYFEPFVSKNIPLHYSILSKSKEINYMFFKGDADQDRPNHYIPKNI